MKVTQTIMSEVRTFMFRCGLKNKCRKMDIFFDG